MKIKIKIKIKIHIKIKITITKGQPCLVKRHGSIDGSWPRVQNTPFRLKIRAFFFNTLSRADGRMTTGAVKSGFIISTRRYARATHIGASRRGGATLTTDRRPPTLRAARYRVDTTDAQRARRAPVEFKMSCVGDARRRSTLQGDAND